MAGRRSWSYYFVTNGCVGSYCFYFSWDAWKTLGISGKGND